jgi:hypothetical protein
VLDNARIHHARRVKEKARQLDIHLLFLPAYSPKYNPIEFLWKDGKESFLKKLILTKPSSKPLAYSSNSCTKGPIPMPRPGVRNSFGRKVARNTIVFLLHEQIQEAVSCSLEV